MDIKTLAELTTADPRTLSFTPLGLSTRGRLSPADAAKFQQEAVARADLADNVAEGTRKAFERVRSLHAYGVLCYETYTVAHDSAWMLVEQALRERFIDFYSHSIPLVDRRSGVSSPLIASDFSVVEDAFGKGGSHQRGDWALPLADGTTMAFRGSLGQLQEWARREGLLNGQRNKWLEPLFRRMRNRVAHPHYHLVSPVESARIIRDLAEIINRLWGHSTPGGRLYPAPISREILVVAWREDGPGRSHVILPGSEMERFREEGGWRCVIVRGVWGDDDLWDFDTEYERTTFPTDLLWGPGTPDEALSWLRGAQPHLDAVSPLDRVFAVRLHAGRRSLARRPEVALALPFERQAGRWLLLRADLPSDAFLHAGHVMDGVQCAGSKDPFQACPVEELFEGEWSDMVRQLSTMGFSRKPAGSQFRVPPRFIIGPRPDVEDD